MLKELIEYFNSIKKTQAEMKVTLSEIKKNLQEPAVEAGIQINDLEHKEEKKKYSIRTARRKKNSEK